MLLLWTLNSYNVWQDYNQRIRQQIDQHHTQHLEHKGQELEELFRTLYQHTRTISLIPAIRAVTGPNRTISSEDVIAQGRLSPDIDETIKQIYTNLYHNIRLSEIYYILDGFEPEMGDVPFIMYDANIKQPSRTSAPLDPKDLALPAEVESEEYDYYVRQLALFRQHYPEGGFNQDIGAIPALISPLMQTCDNAQYPAIAPDKLHNTFGLLYSVPVFDLDSTRFKGIISAVLRANVLEATLLGVPYLPVTLEEQLQLLAEGWSMPDKPSEFILTHQQHNITIADRRNPVFRGLTLMQIRQLEGEIASTPLDIVSDGEWQLHHYFTPATVATMTHGLRWEQTKALLARAALLLLLLAIFWRAQRDTQRHHQELIHLAHYDSLTSLPNRRLLLQRLEQSMSRSARRHHCLGLMFVDIDDFGTINDTLGHRTGDLVLIAIAKRLRKTIRLSDELTVLTDEARMPTVARLGGDDFAIIFEELKQPEEGVIIGERIQLTFQEPITIEGQQCEITICSGMAVFPDDAHSTDELMACADYALRHAADKGPGQFQMYNDEMRQKAARQIQLMRDLPHAVRHGLFEVHYQPKQVIATDQIISFEALLRWRHETLGMISPIEFIPLLEQSGQIVEAGRWVLTKSCQQLQQWHNEGHQHLHISVNVSPRQLLLSDMEATVAQLLLEVPLPPHQLILEITESMVIDNLLEGNRILQALKSLGVQLAIDDFGTGYSSLTYLQGLPLDYLKLDKSMIDAIADPRGAHVIQATIHLAHGLGMKTIAEGVELPSQRDALQQMGCDLIQGYLLSQPRPPEELERFLHS